MPRDRLGPPRPTVAARARCVSPGPERRRAARRYGVDEVVRLNRNEDLFEPFPGAREAAAAELDHVWMYPEESYSDFREAAAEWIGSTPDRIVPAHGTQALIGTLASLLLDPGDAVVVPQPSYGLYAQAVHCARRDRAPRAPARAPPRPGGARGERARERRAHRLGVRPEQPDRLARARGRVARVSRRAAGELRRRRRRGLRGLRRSRVAHRARSATSRRAGRSSCCARCRSSSGSRGCGSATPSSTRSSRASSTSCRSRSTSTARRSPRARRACGSRI